MALTRLQGFLDGKRVRYQTILHSPAYTAQELAQAAHVRGWELAKSTMLKIDGRLVMAVLPSPTRVDVTKIERLTGARRVEIASEAEFAQTFPDCELGAMPPFGNLYGVPVYVDEQLAGDDNIVFPAGSHGEAIRMHFKDFRRLAEPVILDLSEGWPRGRRL